MGLVISRRQNRMTDRCTCWVDIPFLSIGRVGFSCLRFPGTYTLEDAAAEEESWNGGDGRGPDPAVPAREGAEPDGAWEASRRVAASRHVLRGPRHIADAGAPHQAR